MMQVKVSSKGLVTLPKQIREKFKIDKGDHLTVSAEGRKIIFQKVETKVDWENSDDIWKEYAAKRIK